MKRLFSPSLLFLARALCFCLVAQYALAEEPSELVLRAEIATAASDALWRQDYAELDKMSGTFLSEKSRTSSGLWRLTFFYEGIAGDWSAGEPAKIRVRWVESDEAWSQREEQIAAWVKSSPKSPAARISYAIAQYRHAWFLRGDGYAGTVAEEAWPKFKAYIEKARKSLADCKAMASRDPVWYETMIRVANSQGWDKARFRALANEAVKKEPGYYQTYFSAAAYYLPKWHGTPAQVEAFANQSLRDAKAEDKKSLYARIYWAVAQAECDCEVFQKKYQNWPRVKAGFEDMTRQYPDSWNLNAFARFACLANDHETTVDVFNRLHRNFEIAAWGGIGRLEQCLSFAGMQGYLEERNARSRLTYTPPPPPRFRFGGSFRVSCPAADMAVPFPDFAPADTGFTVTYKAAAQTMLKNVKLDCAKEFRFITIFVDAKGYYFSTAPEGQFSDATPAWFVDGKTGDISERNANGVGW